MSNEAPSWSKFEHLIAAIERQTVPSGAVVQHNHRVKGRSGRMRQIDVSIAHKVGFHKIFIAVECKQYLRLITIDKVEAFAKKLEDIRATQGVMISEKGFDNGAKAIALDNGITLLSYKEADALDWEQTFNTSAWIKLTVGEIEKLSLGVRSDQTQDFPLTPYTQLYSPLGVPIYRIVDLFEEFYKLNVHRFLLGETRIEIDLNTSFFIHLETDARIKIDAVSFEFVLSAKEYTLNPGLLEGHIIRDDLSGEVLFQQLTSQGVNIKEFLERQEGRPLIQEEYARNNLNGILLSRLIDELQDTYYFAYHYGVPPPPNP